MSESRIRLDAIDESVAKESPAHDLKRIALDSRCPRALDHHGYALRVIAGRVDVFAVWLNENREGARHHLFRVEENELILDLVGPSLSADDRVHVIAVGAAGAEALMVPRQRIQQWPMIADWIGRLGKLMAAQPVDWTIRETENDSRCEMMAGERRRGSSDGIVWVFVLAGSVQLMGMEPAYLPAGPPTPIMAGMWIEAGADGATVVFSKRKPSGEDELWAAIDRFHSHALASIQQRMVAHADQTAQRMLRRLEILRSRTGELLHELSAIVIRSSDTARPISEREDPLVAACQIAAGAIDAQIVRPPERTPSEQSFDDVVEIARTSRLRVRRTLLRTGWWNQDVGALVAWHGDARTPVALIPGSRHRYLMIEPKSGVTRPVTEAIAVDIAPEAAMFYAALPARSLSLRDLLAFSVRHTKGNVARIAIATALLGLLSLVPPVVTQQIVNSVIPRTEYDQLIVCAAALTVTAISMACIQMMQGLALLRLEGVLDWKLQAAIVDRLLRLPASLFRQYTVGDLVARSLGIDAIRKIFTGQTVRSLFAGVVCWFSFLLMFYYDPRLALIAVALTILRVAMIATVGAIRLYHETRNFNLQGKLEGFVLQLLAGIGKLKVGAGTIRALAVWTRQFAAQKRHFIASQRAGNVLSAIDSSFPIVATLIIFLAAEEPGKLTLDLGSFLAFFTAFGQAIASVGQWAGAISESLIVIPHLSRIKPLIVSPLELSEDRRPAGQLSGSLELSRVTFRYVPAGPPVLDNVTLQIGAGEYVAIVGPSGSGKSTIFRLLLGFEKPESGAIFFDGKALETIDISALRRQMGVVLQHGKLASGSIYDNICGGVQLPVEQVWEAARLAGLEPDLKAMPMGIHTVIAEGVSTISGGQRQRLMIARAIAHRPRIVLFDEATSSLDNTAQATVSASLGRLNVTRVVIAHRLSTVRESDRIVVLVDGKIVQTGKFAELSETSGVFADLVRRQLL